MNRHKDVQQNAKSGQISILIVFSLIPMFTLFAFVVNVGMLVNAKISLQNAADLAAYSGAATQARQMTRMSHLNYQMRQTYKKFLFKYYVMGNLSLKCFPGGPADPACTQSTGRFDWINPLRATPAGAVNSTNFPGMPIVCVSLSTTSNACQLGTASIPIVTPPPCLPIDPACAAIQNAAQQIAGIQKASCAVNSTINQELLAYWLFATDFDSPLNSNPNLKGLISDLGLVTEEMLHKGRVETLRSYVNFPPETNLTFAQLRAKYENWGNLPEAERINLAFRTAYNNLNGNVFESDSIEFTELIPKGRELLKVSYITPKFDVGYARMENNSSADDCRMRIKFYKGVQPTIGFYKTPDTYVYYGVKLTAKAHLLFNPFPFGNAAESITLTAYSAAAPFGSRLGPTLPNDLFVRDVTTGPTVADGADVGQHPIPVLKVDDQKTWEDLEILKAYHDVLAGGGTSTVTGAVQESAYRKGLYAALLPDEDEIGKYNIPVDTSYVDGNGTLHEMDPMYRPSNQAGQVASAPADYTFWAPFQKVGDQGFKDQIKDQLDTMISFTTNAVGGGTAQALKALLEAGLDKVFSSLTQGNNFNIARIPDPLATSYWQGNYPNVPGKVVDTKKLATSFTTDHDSNYYRTGRDGYSVKFISFKSLFQNPGRLTNTPGETLWTPLSDTFANEKAQLVKVAH